MNLIKLSASRITGTLLALCMALGLCGCSKPEPEESIISTSPDNTQAKAETTEGPTEEPTEEPVITEAPWTKENRDREEDRSWILENFDFATLPFETCPMWQDIDHLSRSLMEHGRDYLSRYDMPIIDTDDGLVHFEITDEAMIVYETMDLEYETEDVICILDNPMFLLPRELGIRAEQSLIDFYNEHVNLDDPVEYDHEDASIQMSGIMGENYIIFIDRLHNDQIMGGCNHVGIFMTEDGENWKQIKCKEPSLFRLITGGTVLSDKEAYICVWPRNCNALSLYHTVDGGETWKNSELVVSDEIGEQWICSGHALNPVFDGDHGIIVTYCLIQQSDKVNGGGITHEEIALGWFETNDGGETWEFVDSGVRFDPELAY